MGRTMERRVNAASICDDDVDTFKHLHRPLDNSIGHVGVSHIAINELNSCSRNLGEDFGLLPFELVEAARDENEVGTGGCIGCGAGTANAF